MTDAAPEQPAQPAGFCRSLLTSPAGDTSSKRLIGVGLAFCLVIAVGADIAGHPVHDHLLDLIAGVVTAFMAACTADHFAGRNQ